MSVGLDDVDPVDLARRLHTWGSENVAFDVLMVLGPLVIVAVALGGRNALTTLLVVAYVAGFGGALGWNVLGGDQV